MSLSPAAILFDTSGTEKGTLANPVTVSLTDGFNTPIRSTVSQELKVAQLYTLADLTAKYEIDPRLWDVWTSTGGTAAHVPTESAVRVSATGASGSEAILRTNTFYKYQAGYTQFISMSVICSDTGQANQIRRWGYFDENDGLFFQLTGTGLRLVERTSTSGSVVNTEYLQAAWNVDPMDGTGPSGMTLDVSKGNIYELEFQWFGVGEARYYVNGFLVHKNVHDNLLAVPYMRTAHLPIQLQITNTGASSAGSITMVCTRVAAQGQIHDPFSWVYAVATPSDVSVGKSERPILSVRPKATYNSIVNRAWLLPRKLAIQTEAYRINYKVVCNATLTGASWTSVSGNSTADYDVSATAYSGGDTIFEGYISTDGGSADTDLSAFFDVLGRLLRNAGFTGSGVNSADTLTIVAINEAVGTTKVRTQLTWAEIR